jgi:hypothetical protein
MGCICRPVRREEDVCSVMLVTLFGSGRFEDKVRDEIVTLRRISVE